MENAKELRQELSSLYRAQRSGQMNMKEVRANVATLSQIRKSAADQIAYYRDRPGLPDIEFLKEEREVKA